VDKKLDKDIQGCTTLKRRHLKLKSCIPIELAKSNEEKIKLFKIDIATIEIRIRSF